MKITQAQNQSKIQLPRLESPEVSEHQPRHNTDFFESMIPPAPMPGYKPYPGYFPRPGGQIIIVPGDSPIRITIEPIKPQPFYGWVENLQEGQREKLKD